MEKNNIIQSYKVAILLSTYNGAQYISNQINSIINQTYKNWILYIRDDGSNDNTLSIIKSYIEKDNRIRLVNDTIIHRGVKDSYMWLLSQVNEIFYMFCDQDDVWMPDKIEECVKILMIIPASVPSLVTCDLQLVDENLKVINESMWETHHLTRLVDNDEGLYIAAMFPGCTMGFNELTKRLVLDESFKFNLHDQQVSMVVKKNNGSIHPIHKSLIKYRQHSKNVVGLYAGNNWIFHKLIKINEVLKKDIYHMRMVHDFLKVGYMKYLMLKIQHIFKLI